MLFLILFATVDFCRYYVACTVLQTGAEAGVDRAREVPDFDLDWRGKLPTDGDYLRFVQARTRILDEAESAASVATKQGQPSAVTLRDITQTDSGFASGGPAPSCTRSSAALRPGDCADVSGYGTLCNAPEGSRLPSGDLMKAFPIRVVILAEVSSVVPFVGPYLASGGASGHNLGRREMRAGLADRLIRQGAHPRRMERQSRIAWLPEMQGCPARFDSLRRRCSCPASTGRTGVGVIVCREVWHGATFARRTRGRGSRTTQGRDL